VVTHDIITVTNDGLWVQFDAGTWFATRVVRNSSDESWFLDDKLRGWPVGLDGWAGVERFNHCGTDVYATREEALRNIKYLESMAEKKGLRLMHIVWERGEERNE
jgi:hypothetical protein